MSLIVLNGGVTGTLFTQADVDLTAIEIVNDTSPELGGNLDANANDILDVNLIEFNNTHASNRRGRLQKIDGPTTGVVVHTDNKVGGQGFNGSRSTALRFEQTDGTDTLTIGQIEGIYGGGGTHDEDLKAIKIRLFQDLDPAGNYNTDLFQNSKVIMSATYNDGIIYKTNDMKYRLDDGTDAFQYTEDATKEGGILIKLFGDTRFEAPMVLKSYTVANLPTTTIAGAQAYCTDDVGGAVPVFYDGANWRRVTDRSVASTT